MRGGKMVKRDSMKVAKFVSRQGQDMTAVASAVINSSRCFLSVMFNACVNLKASIHGYGV